MNNQFVGKESCSNDLLVFANPNCPKTRAYIYENVVQKYLNFMLIKCGKKIYIFTFVNEGTKLAILWGSYF